MGGRQPALDLLGEDREVSAHRLVALVASAVLLAGCSGSDEPPAADASPSPTAITPAPAPARGACYDLSFEDAIAPSSTADPVPCAEPHTATTFHVGRIKPVVDGHLLALDSTHVQAQVVRGCQSRLAAYLGGSEEDQRLSRFLAVGFAPTLEQGDEGARWYRCDVVLLRAPERLARLPRETRGVLDADGALDRYGTCGTAAPAADRFARVVCSRPHTWRARATIDLPADASYLDSAAGKTADSACRDIDARIAANSLKLRWSFEWPTREQWDAGQRYGYCWTPDPA